MSMRPHSASARPAAPHPLRPSRRRPLAAWLMGLIAACGAASAAAAELELVGPTGAVVTIDGAEAGALPLPPLTLPPGRHEVACRARGCVEFRQVILLSSEESRARVQIRLLPLSRRTAWSSNLLLAGLGQTYLGRPTRGLVYHAAEIGGLLAALAGEIQRSDHRRDYLLLSDRYAAAINADDIAALRAAADKAYADMQDMESLRDTGLLVAAGAVVLSALDALLTFPRMEAGFGTRPARPLQASAAWAPEPGTWAAVHAGVRLEF